MTAIITALIPILCLILLGFLLKRIQFVPDATWPGLEKLTYFILFPALIVYSLGRQQLDDNTWWPVLQVILVVLFAGAMVLIVWFKIWGRVSNATFTSIFQGGVRFNTYIAFAVAQSFYGSKGLAAAAVAAGFMIVLVNLFCVLVFSIWSTGRSITLKRVFLDVIGNPMIIACAIGWFLNLSGIGLPSISAQIVEIIARAALPIGLLVVGAALRLDAVRGHVQAITLSSTIQFVVNPLVTWLMVQSIGLTGVAAATLIIMFMTPTATAAYMLSRQLGGDSETMASIITFQTLFAFVTMPITVLLLL